MTTTQPTSIRVAAIQIDFQPSAVISYPFLEEPTVLAEGEAGISTFQCSSSELQAIIIDLVLKNRTDSIY